MIRMIGNGGHALVAKEIVRLTFMDRPTSGSFVAIGDNKARKKEAEALEGPFAILIHPSAIVSDSATIGEGSIIMAGAIIQPKASIGKHCIVNSGATLDHHCILGDYAHIAPGAHLCGAVHVGEGTLVGVGVGIAPQTTVPAWSIVKAARLDVQAI